MNPGALVLISPFTSIKDVVKFNYGGLASGMLKERFSNKQRILDVNCPVLFIHGKEDKLIPFKASKSLYGKKSIQKLFTLTQHVLIPSAKPM